VTDVVTREALWHAKRDLALLLESASTLHYTKQVHARGLFLSEGWRSDDTSNFAPTHRKRHVRPMLLSLLARSSARLSAHREPKWLVLCVP